MYQVCVYIHIFTDIKQNKCFVKSINGPYKKNIYNRLTLIDVACREHRMLIRSLTPLIQISTQPRSVTSLHALTLILHQGPKLVTYAV